MTIPEITKKRISQVELGVFNDFDIHVNASSKIEKGEDYITLTVGALCVLATDTDSGFEVNINDNYDLANGLLPAKFITIDVPVIDEKSYLWFVEVKVTVAAFCQSADVAVNYSSRPRRRKGGKIMVRTATSDSEFN